MINTASQRKVAAHIKSRCSAWPQNLFVSPMVVAVQGPAANQQTARIGRHYVTYITNRAVVHAVAWVGHTGKITLQFT